MESDLNIMIPRAYRNSPDPDINSNKSLLLLHEAARRYDHEYLEALLQEHRYNIQSLDPDGRSSLHILLQDGN